MSQVMNTPNGPLLCSRINANSATRGDMLVSDDAQRVARVQDVCPDYIDNGLVVLHLAAPACPWRVRLGVNTPVWRAVGARAAGLIT